MGTEPLIRSRARMRHFDVRYSDIAAFMDAALRSGARQHPSLPLVYAISSRNAGSARAPNAAIFASAS
jgi:hypothetical protein